YSDGANFAQKPVATDDALFLGTLRKGLICLDRETGEAKWKNSEAGRFLAYNPKFVYAFDRSGRFLVLDLERGTKLSSYDLREFVFPVANDRTDRIYLAAHNGLLVCLHDEDYAKPLSLKTDDKPPPPPPAGKPGEKPGERPAEKPGDKPGEKPVDKSSDKPADKGEKK